MQDQRLQRKFLEGGSEIIPPNHSGLNLDAPVTVPINVPRPFFIVSSCFIVPLEGKLYAVPLICSTPNKEQLYRIQPKAMLKHHNANLQYQLPQYTQRVCSFI